MTDYSGIVSSTILHGYSELESAFLGRVVSELWRCHALCGIRNVMNVSASSRLNFRAVTDTSNAGNPSLCNF